MTNEAASSFAPAGTPVRELPLSGEPAHAGTWKPLPPLASILPAHVAYVCSVVGRMSVRRREDREDLVQEVLFQAYRSRGSRLDVRALLFGIARHVVLKWRAKRRAERSVLVRNAGVEPMTAHCAEGDWQARLRGEIIRAAIGDLPPLHREVFCRSEIDGIPMPSLARTLGICPNTGYARLHVARARFRECLDHILTRRRMKGWELL